MFSDWSRSSWLLPSAAAMLLAGCASEGVKAMDKHESTISRVKLSSLTLEFAHPTLKPSKDFGPVLLVTEVDLDQVVKPKTLFHGYWDGPRYQLLSVTGTLNIWLDVLPWPDVARTEQGCKAKLKAFVAAAHEADLTRYRRGGRRTLPSMDQFEIPLAGRDGLRYQSSYDPNVVNYIFPVDSRFVMRLMFNSANNSGLGSEWAELSAREQDRFLRSLALSGDPADCR